MQAHCSHRQALLYRSFLFLNLVEKEQPQKERYGTTYDEACRERASLKRSSYIVELTEELEMCLPATGNTEETLDAKLLGETINRFLLTLPDEKSNWLYHKREEYSEEVAYGY